MRKIFSPKWEIDSGNDSGVVTNIDSATGRLTIDFDKMTNWAEVVEIKVSAADKSDSYKLAIINAKNIDLVDIDRILIDAKNAVKTAQSAAANDMAYDAAYATYKSANFSITGNLDSAINWLEDLVGYNAAEAIEVAKEFGFSADTDDYIKDAPAVKCVYTGIGGPYNDDQQETSVELNRAAAKAAAEFAQKIYNKDSSDDDKAKAARFAMTAVNVCEVGAAAFWTLRAKGLNDKSKAQVAYAVYAVCKYVWTLIDNDDNVDVARTKADMLKPLCYTSDELNEIAEAKNISNFSIY